MLPNAAHVSSRPAASPLPSTSPLPSPSPSAPKITRGHSCVLCQQRKVRCDRAKPCSNCVKAGVECVASAPPAPRRRKKHPPATDLAARLQRCEDLLKKHGVKVDDGQPGEEKKPRTRDDEIEMEMDLEMDQVGLSLLDCPREANGPRSPRCSGTLVANKGNTYYVENTLWENLRDEIQSQEAKDSSQHSSDDEVNDTGLYPNAGSLLLGHVGPATSLTSQHPQPVQIFRLWQTFLTNVNPLTKIFHAPTVQQMILDASGDLEHVPRPTEALMFSIYLLAVTSMKPEDCETMFGQSQSALLLKYSHATQHALVRASYLRSLNLVTLQAFTLFLLALRRSYDPHSLWILTGAAVRISQRLGLHLDGSSHNLPPFEAEMRRRVWWQVIFLDGHSSKLSGSGFPAWLARFDTRMPLNISDSSLSPAMTELPREHPGATEMMFCMLRYEVSEAVRKSKFVRKMDGNWSIATGIEVIAEKDKAINELEQRFEEKYLRYADPSIPLHLLCTFMAKSVICIMRIMAHHPRQYPDKGASMPQAERDMLFVESLKMLEYDRLGHTEKSIQGYLWHINAHFQPNAFIFLLSELRQRPSGELVERAWKQVEDAYKHRPEMAQDTKNSLYFAIGNLAIKAWEKRERALGRYMSETPQFIIQLRSQRKQAEPPRAVSNQNFDESFMRTNINPPNYNLPETSFLSSTSQFLAGGSDLDFAFDPNMTPVDWEYWQTLMDGCDLPSYGEIGQNFFA